MSNELTRMEVRLPAQSREVHDLGHLAESVKGNASRRGEAATYIIRLWSRVLHGEMSPTTFWDMFGVPMPQLASVATSPSPGEAVSITPIPALAALPASVSPASVDNLEVVRQQQKRERARQNRAAASWEP